MDTIIQTSKLTRAFRVAGSDFYAVHNVDLNVERGTLTALRGRSGSGKTTTLNMLSGLDEPTSGTILFDGIELTKMSEAKRDRWRRNNVGFIFQSVALIAQMSAYENVEFGLRLAGYPAAERAERARECLTFVGLRKRMHHRPAELSGGEQQRVAIARAIAHKPKVIFADEPTAELDTVMALQVMRVFRDLVEKEGATILLTSHDPNMMQFVDHIYTLVDGEITEEEFNEIERHDRDEAEEVSES